MSKIAVIGAGSWGTALALTLEHNGHDVVLWTHRANQAEEINTTHINSKYLPDIIIPENLICTSDLQAAAENADGIVMAVPSHAVAETATKLAPFIDEKVVLISVGKGYDPATRLRLSELLEQQFPNNPVVVFSGPSHAEEVARHMHTAIVSASKNEQAAVWVQDIFSCEFMRVYTNSDVVGVEIAGACKNIIALACGMCYGYGGGDNTEAAVLTRGLAEITRLGMALGAEAQTFLGLAGVGDLVVTCGSMHSRNRRAGMMLGEGKTLAYVQENMGMVVEGVNATRYTHEIAESLGVDMPITASIYNILYGGGTIQETVSGLMSRTKKSE